MRRRIGSISRRDSANRSVPSKIARPPTGPPLGSCRRSRARPSVVLPDPDSPTTPSVWPARRRKVAPLTAWNSLRPKTPLRIQKLLVSAVASTITGASGSLVTAARVRGVAGDVVVDHHQARRALLERRPAGEQRLGVGVLRRGEDAVDRPLLADDAVAHHDDVVGDLADHAEVVADEQHAHPVPRLQARRAARGSGAGSSRRARSSARRRSAASARRRAPSRSSRAAAGRRRAGADRRRGAASARACRPRRAALRRAPAPRACPGPCA